MHFGSVCSAAMEVIWPTRCVVCDEPGELLCESCRNSLPWIEQRLACPNCGAPFGRLTCTECDLPQGGGWEVRSCVCALPLKGAGRALAVAHKDAGERRLAAVIAAIIATSLDEAATLPATDGSPRFDANETDAICFVPATPEAFRRRGFDHMEAIARFLALFLDLPLADVLAREDAKDQRKLGREGRKANLESGVMVIEDVTGCSLLLVDDVLTTGTTVRACTRCLLEAGAADITACALARSW